MSKENLFSKIQLLISQEPENTNESLFSQDLSALDLESSDRYVSGASVARSDTKFFNEFIEAEAILESSPVNSKDNIASEIINTDERHEEVEIHRFKRKAKMLSLFKQGSTFLYNQPDAFASATKQNSIMVHSTMNTLIKPRDQQEAITTLNDSQISDPSYPSQQ